MGQAKQRGSFEDRQAQSLERQKKERELKYGKIAQEQKEQGRARLVTHRPIHAALLVATMLSR